MITYGVSFRLCHGNAETTDIIGYFVVETETIVYHLD